MDRSKKIIQTSILGIVVNIVLVLFKMTIGLIVGSIAIVLDAINNLSDALSSIITIAGTKLSEKAPDKKHPYGYGRIEYLTSVIISVIVLIVGITSIKESITKLIHPEPAEYTILSLVIIAVAVVVKFVMGRYVKKVGEDIRSQSLIASGADAFFDSILSLATLVAAIISMVWHLSLEGILGVIISIIIIKAGIEMLIETLNSIIGVRADAELTSEIKQKVASYKGVNGAYDLVLHNYGPTKTMGTVHIEVDDTLTAKEVYDITRQISIGIHKEYHIILTVGIYSSNTTGEFAEMRRQVAEIAQEVPGVLGMHGFYADPETHYAVMDIVVAFKFDPPAVQKQVYDRLRETFTEYDFGINLDINFSD